MWKDFSDVCAVLFLAPARGKGGKDWTRHEGACLASIASRTMATATPVPSGRRVDSDLCRACGLAAGAVGHMRVTVDDPNHPFWTTRCSLDRAAFPPV